MMYINNTLFSDYEFTEYWSPCSLKCSLNFNQVFYVGPACDEGLAVPGDPNSFSSTVIWVTAGLPDCFCVMTGLK